METKKEIKLEDVFNDEKRQAIKEFIDKQEIKRMKTIYKYTLDSHDCTLQLPKGAEILTVQLQNQIPTLWALVNPMTVTEERHICIVGTGWDVEDTM